MEKQAGWYDTLTQNIDTLDFLVEQIAEERAKQVESQGRWCPDVSSDWLAEREAERAAEAEERRIAAAEAEAERLALEALEAKEREELEALTTAKRIKKAAWLAEYKAAELKRLGLA